MRIADFNQKLSKVLVWHSTKPRPGELVNIRYDSLAEPLALAVFEEVTRAGANAVFQALPEGAIEILVNLGTDEQIDHLHDLAYWCREKPDVEIGIRAPANTRALSTIDHERLARRAAAQAPIGKIFMERQARGELRWVLTDIPTHGSAQEAGMSLTKFEEFVYRAGMLYLDDPIAYWQAFTAWQQGVVDQLNSGYKTVHLEGPNIDLRMSIAGGTWINCGGQKNFPDGEAFVGPDKGSANGWLRMTFPTHYQDNVVEGVFLRFEDGVVVEASATKGEEFLLATLDTDEGARGLGELGIGTHRGITRPTGFILFDEKMGGTVHLALGRGYPDSGNNNESAVHWDFIVPMEEEGKITMDGKVVYANGDFLVGDPSARPIPE